MQSESLEIRAGTERHTRLVTALRDRYLLSKNRFTARHKDWRDAERLYQGYAEKDSEELAREAAMEDGKDTFSRINISYSSAILMTAHTYWSSVFLGRVPVFQYMGRHGEPQDKVLGVEALVDYQVQQGKMMVPLFNWLLDAGKFGLGVVGSYWEDEVHAVSRYETTQDAVNGIPVEGEESKKRITEMVRGYSGTKLFNIRPYDWFCDPRVAVTEFQSGEFCGHVTTIGWNEVKKREAAGEYFNIEKLEQSASQGGTQYRDRESGFKENLNPWESNDQLLGSGKGEGNKSYTEVLVMVVELVPKDWELGSSEYPEKWAFTLANEDLVIGARPLGEYHNKFPYNILTYELDPYQNYLRGILQIGKPFNDTITWLMNSHFYNVRKSLNDQLILDPSRVNIKDVTDGGPGRVIRLKPGAYGSSVKDVIQQLPVQDITRANIADSELMVNFLQRLFGVNDSLMGAIDPGGRKTATEVRASSSAAVNRLKTFAEYNSALGFQPLSEMIVQSTQQHYSDEKQFRIVGDLTNGESVFTQVTPESIAGFYDFVAVDGTFPVDRFAQANLWKEVLMGLGQMPAIGGQYDIGGIFSWMAKLAGLRNINQFKLPQGPGAGGPQLNVMPDEQIQAGNGGVPLQ